MSFSDYLITKEYEYVAQECWVSLHFDDPEIAGAYASEISGSGYLRVLAEFGPIANRSIWVTNVLSWQGLPQNRLTHIAGWNAQYQGDHLWSSRLGTPARILEGKGYTIPANSVVLSRT